MEVCYQIGVCDPAVWLGSPEAAAKYGHLRLIYLAIHWGFHAAAFVLFLLVLTRRTRMASVLAVAALFLPTAIIAVSRGPERATETVGGGNVMTAVLQWAPQALLAVVLALIVRALVGFVRRRRPAPA
jgi:hypothetical protein